MTCSTLFSASTIPRCNLYNDMLYSIFSLHHSCNLCNDMFYIEDHRALNPIRATQPAQLVDSRPHSLVDGRTATVTANTSANRLAITLRTHAPLAPWKLAICRAAVCLATLRGQI
ncbi:hypothetical protein RRG08_026373 [Elysia crispata]|uniref:Uncharacterized protein n=1 Tax=Elysia crispata TaxID=231223 RepID=A0AAE1CL56_9GAST|nr:hypothetical protein RRG08_026373 [Elysia crispata]